MGAARDLQAQPVAALEAMCRGVQREVDGHDAVVVPGRIARGADETVADIDRAAAAVDVAEAHEKIGEFELGGLTREQDADGVERVRYASPTDLLRQTPEFIQRTLDDRLDNLFGRAHNYFCAHFGGRNLYLEAIQRNRFLLERLLAQRDEALLLRTPLHI